MKKAFLPLCIMHCALCISPIFAHGGEKVIKDGDTLVFMGDSITQFGKNTVDGYLRLVVQGLAANGIDVTWHGVGVSGQTAVQMKNRFKKDVVEKHADVVTIFAGVNDCAYGWPDKTNSTPDDVAAMADMADSSTGREIRFADGAGKSLPYEIESWDPNGTSLVWVKARVNSSDNRAYHGQAMLTVPDSTLLDVGDDFTLSGWVKMTDTTKADGLARIASRNHGGDYAPDWELAIAGYDTLNGYSGSKTPVSGAIPSAETNWVHIAGVFDGTNLTAYANGVKVFEAPIAAVKDTDNKLVFGAKDRTMVRGHFTGLFDEFRLRDAVSSADWIKAEYDQSQPSFLTFDGAKATSR